MKIKFNWGFGILISIIFFMAATVVMVTLSMNQKIDLVTDNYYEKTLTYQKQIDKESRSSKYENDFEVFSVDKNINIKFPEIFSSVPVKGELYFYRPSNANDDFTIPINLDDKGKQIISSAQMEKGFWKVKVEWAAAKENYFCEKSIVIN